ncbi:putative ankyrin repeat-containing domain-containing protein [Rosa chinensis]|uniref:Putative ankyrin repeat-containing domain-containing protein n=1 Tax=Rosa chinensis TaxID=74649 RepID=A0A2P6RX92_ROSCH|nr:putative ankyrin repeat-containing domain-containing protein [Rosa chinensis]
MNKGCPRFAWKVDSNGCLPLHIACEKGHLEIARTLLMIDPDLALEFDHYHYTPVHLAAMVKSKSLRNFFCALPNV